MREIWQVPLRQSLPEVSERYAGDTNVFVASLGAALDKITDEKGRFLYTSRTMLAKELKENQRPNLNLETIGSQLRLPTSMMISKHSPWKRILNKGLLHLRQSGFVDTIVSRRQQGTFIQRGLSSSGGGGGWDVTETTVMAGTHVALIFFGYVGTLVGVIMLLALECARNKCRERQITKEKLQQL